MRRILMCSLGAWTLGAALVSAAEPPPRLDRTDGQRSPVPADPKATSNPLTLRPNYRSFTEVNEARALLSEPAERSLLNTSGAARFLMAADAQGSTRDFRDRTPVRDSALSKVQPNEKANAVSEVGVQRFMLNPAGPRLYMQDAGPSKENRRDFTPSSR